MGIMSPEVLALIAVVGLLLQIVVASYTIIKVSFMAGEMKQKVSDHDRRIAEHDQKFRDLEKAEKHKKLFHLEA